MSNTPRVPIFEVLAEPNRRLILDLLREDERPVSELVDALGVSQPAVSKHLKVLREAGIVEFRTVAQQRLYSVRPEPLLEVERWLAPYRRMWADSLDSLERHLEEMDKPKKASKKGGKRS
jgi:DNA-binding transcriptional ArsR family regulator